MQVESFVALFFLLVTSLVPFLCSVHRGLLGIFSTLLIYEMQRCCVPQKKVDGTSITKSLSFSVCPTSAMEQDGA